jgi:hypothetical protein
MTRKTSPKGKNSEEDFWTKLHSTIANWNDAELTLAELQAHRLIEQHEKNGPKRSAVSAECARNYLFTRDFLKVAIKNRNQDEAIQAAIHLGLSSRMLLAGSPRNPTTGKSVIEMAFDEHRRETGRPKSRVIKANDTDQLIAVLQLYRTGSRFNYKQVAAELVRRGIKGRNGKSMSTKTIARRRSELVKAGKL